MKKTKKESVARDCGGSCVGAPADSDPFPTERRGSVRFKALVYEVTKIHQLPSETDADYAYIEGIEVKILGVTVYRKTNQ